MAGPDLTYATRRVEALMDDTCLIERVDETAEPVVNDVTGELSAGIPDQIYGGTCMFRPLVMGSDRQTPEGGGVNSITRYRLSTPLTAPVLKPGDIITITFCRRDPTAVGMRLRVTEATYRTMAVSRVAICEERARVSDRP